MCEAEMSPRLLNIEKLEKKFASLTRSRESIQGLSLWIIRHKEFYKEIVNQWLDALTRDFNALTMFYVANDVIQNCGRKKAPEYREAFATVLEKAVSLQKIKDIKMEVTRMLTLWHDRSIYDDAFFKKLEDKLNAAVELEESDVEIEISEDEVIANFKLENVINSLRNLQTMEDELLEKESFLEDIEEPVISNLDNLIVKLESQREIRKFDRYQKLVEDYLSLSDKVIAAKKSILLDLKYSNIFYSAQNEDAKKVAHAYRIYGKKVKLLEKSLQEKMSSLPIPSPPSPDSSSSSIDLSSLLKSSPSFTDSPTENKNNYDGNSSNISKGSQIELTENVIIEKSENVIIEKSENVIIEKSENVIIEKSENVIIEKSENIINEKPENTIIEKAENLNEKSEIIKNETSEIISEKSEILINEKSENIFDNVSPTADSEKSNFEIEKSIVINESAVKVSESVDETWIKVEIPEEVSVPSNSIDSDVKNTDDTVLKKVPTIHEDIDFLLEKAYDDQVKKPNIKRKIDNLLKLKQSKTCKLDNSEDIANTPKENKNSSESVSVTKIPNSERQTSIHLSENKIDTTTKPLEQIEETGTEEKLNDSDNVIEVPIPDKIEDVKVVESIEMTQPVLSTQISAETISTNDSSDNKSIPTSKPFSFQTLPDIPTELLKNILNKHRVNMNLPTNADLPIFNEMENLTSESAGENESKSSGNEEDIVLSSTQVLTGEAPSSEPVKATDSKEKNSHDLEDINTDEGACQDVKDLVCKEEILDENNGQRDSYTAHSTHFLDTLQNVLECFIQKETPSQENFSEAVNIIPSIPLENTLKLYSCIMQNFGNADSSRKISSNLLNSNACPNASCEEMMKSEKDLFQTKMNYVQETLAPVNRGVLDDIKAKDTLSSRNDNLEIMDMDVDSEDES